MRSNHLVYEYKDHGFVIDRDEASERLGSLIVTESPETRFAESAHELLERANLFLWIKQPRRRL